LPPEARGTLFEKTVPLDPLQKLLIKGCFIVPSTRCQRLENFGEFYYNKPDEIN
jgi:hypothetical protein